MLTLKKAPYRSLFAFLILLLPLLVQADERPSRVAIASAHPLATKAGLDILARGGNAFDAAVTVSAVLAVVEPYSSGLGGGGFWLLHRNRDQYDVMVDGREKAPLAARSDLYLDEKGEVIENLSVNGVLAAGIPGEPAALAHIAANYGVLPLSETLAAAIKLASDGFVVDSHYRKMASWRLTALQESDAASDIFLENDAVPPVGYRIKQPDLAATLQRLAESGHNGFYQGETAEKLLQGVRQKGGIWTRKDLDSYQIVERQPVKIQYRGMEITTAALPSSGGIVLAEMLNMLSAYDLASLDEVDRYHLVIEVMRRAYHDRALYLGDSDFVEVPVERLLSVGHARELLRDFSFVRASRSNGLPSRLKGRDTTHFSIIDKDANRVAATLSINYPFGAAEVIEGTGVLLNDEMDDFSAKPGVPNVYGLVGARANAIEPGKRMLSSMTPTFVTSDEGVAILGTPGGSRIISMLLLAILEMDKNTNPQRWVSLPRFHHQYLPDVVQLEKDGLPEAMQKQLQRKGHKLQVLKNTYGNMQAIYWNRQTGSVEAASDPRGIGLAVPRD